MVELEMNEETQPIQLVPPKVRVPVASYGIPIVVLRADVVFEPVQPGRVLDVENGDDHCDLRSAA
jgi:hypothetical protein